MADADRAHKHYLKSLTQAVAKSIAAIDAEMKKPSTPDRGKRIAAITNNLEIENDKARYFGLGIDWRVDRKKRT